MGRILGTLDEADGAGVVRMEDRLPAQADELWDALTSRDRLAVWLGEFDGDLRPGSEYRARYSASGWEGTGTIEAFDPSQRLRSRVTPEHRGTPGSWEVTLTPDGDHTVVVWEERGMPVGNLAAYGAGIQIHVEDLAAYIAGRDIDHSKAGDRWQELSGPYEELDAERAG